MYRIIARLKDRPGGNIVKEITIYDNLDYEKACARYTKEHDDLEARYEKRYSQLRTAIHIVPVE